MFKKNLEHKQVLLNSKCNLSPHSINISVIHLIYTIPESYFKFLCSSEVPVSSFCLFFSADRVISPPHWYAFFIVQRYFNHRKATESPVADLLQGCLPDPLDLMDTLRPLGQSLGCHSLLLGAFVSSQSWGGSISHILITLVTAAIPERKHELFFLQSTSLRALHLSVLLQEKCALSQHKTFRNGEAEKT